MKDWRKTLILANKSIRDAVMVLDQGALQIALVVDDEGLLLGTVTDGDVRRGILRGISLDDPVCEIMNNKPTTIGPNSGREVILSIFREKSLRQVPVVDKSGHVLGLEIIDTIIKPFKRDNIVVLMAGGIGSRLRPYTEQCPKPMLEVGGKPILRIILEQFIESGFSRFYISVNYKAEMIEDYFGDGGRFGVEINYLHEEKRLGTAGALSLLPERPKNSIFVMNGDLLTKINFQHLLAFHADHKAQATMCVREYDFQVPYGVVNLESHRLVAIEEKPLHKFFVNAGIYVLEPDVLDMVETGQYCDMTTIFERLTEEQREVVAFPIREYWIDLGRIEDFVKAQSEFGEVFQ